MPIEYTPRALEFIIRGLYAEKRLKNREGSLMCGGQTTTGGILDLYSQALEYLEQHPHETIRLIEHCCGMNVGL